MQLEYDNSAGTGGLVLMAMVAIVLGTVGHSLNQEHGVETPMAKKELKIEVGAALRRLRDDSNLVAESPTGFLVWFKEGFLFAKGPDGSLGEHPLAVEDVPEDALWLVRPRTEDDPDPDERPVRKGR